MDIKGLIIILMSSVLVDNYVLSRFLGICPFLGVSKKLDQAAGMGVAVTAVMLLACAVTWPIQYYVLNTLNMGYMQNIVFILVIASLVQMLELLLKKFSPSLHKGLGVYLPLITTNCAVLGVAILNTDNKYNLLESTFNGCCAALGFTLAMVLFACIREKLSLAKMPKWMDGFPGALITAGLMAIAFQGFGGLI